MNHPDIKTIANVPDSGSADQANNADGKYPESDQFRIFIRIDVSSIATANMGTVWVASTPQFSNLRSTSSNPNGAVLDLLEKMPSAYFDLVPKTETPFRY